MRALLLFSFKQNNPSVATSLPFNFCLLAALRSPKKNQIQTNKQKNT